MHGVAILCVLGVGACASGIRQGSPSNPSTAASSDQVCHEVTDTATLRSHYVCEPKPDDGDHLRETPRTTGPANPGGAANGGAHDARAAGM